MTWFKLFLILRLVVACGTVWILFRFLLTVLLDHVEILLNHYGQKRTWAQTGEVISNVWWLYYYDAKRILPKIRAKILLKWKLSKLGKKIDLYLVRKRKNEFHYSLTQDMRILKYVNREESEAYRENLVRLRDIAHELDRHEPLITPIN